MHEKPPIQEPIVKKPIDGSKGKQQQPRRRLNSKPRVNVHVVESWQKVLQVPVKGTYAVVVQAEVAYIAVNNNHAVAV